MTDHRSGFVAFVGRPNAGKSTLMNALVGEKLAITSSKPQTTRRAIRGIRTRPGYQLVIVDTPGVHRPRTLLGERLNDLVQSTLGDVDVIGFCTPANEPIGPGDRYIAESLERYPRAKRIALVTKCDLASKKQIAERLLEVDALADWAAVIPISSVTGDQVETVADELQKLLPEGPQLYPDDQRTEETREQRIAELIRESALEGVHDELPHSIAVTIDEIDDEADTTEVYATIHVERDSQKGIVIGRGASRLRQVRQRAAREIRGVLGGDVRLHLHVRVAKEWQRDAKQLGRLGF